LCVQPSQFVQAGEREFLCEIAEASSVNHVVVFITGVHPLPDGLGGSVYVRWPSPGGQDAGWHYLGFICNMKPSVIFKIAQVKCFLFLSVLLNRVNIQLLQFN
ncbi:hypothetical protein TELCIR_07908, partial [Teladorsagia circumcincta]